MIEDISFDARSRGGSEITLQHSTGEVTVLMYADQFPLQAEPFFRDAINTLLKKQPDISPKDELFGLFSWWFTRCNLPMPLAVTTYRNDDRQRIGNRIKALREEQHMDAKQLALKAGIDAANICRIEQGKYSVGLDILSKIAGALGYKVDFVKEEE